MAQTVAPDGLGLGAWPSPGLAETVLVLEKLSSVFHFERVIIKQASSVSQRILQKPLFFFFGF